MPRFYFDVRDNGQLYLDDEGSELGDVRAVHDDAIGLLVDRAQDKLPDGDRHTFVCNVRDESGKTVFEAALSLSCRWLI